MKPIVLFGIQFTLSLVGIGSSHSPGCVIVGMLDTVNAIVQSVRFNVFTYALGVNWVIVTIYVPALLVSSLLIFMQLLVRNRSTTKV